MSDENYLADDKESRQARQFDRNRIAHLRHTASEAFEQGDVPEGVTFIKFFSDAIRYEASSYGGGPLRRLAAKYSL